MNRRWKLVLGGLAATPAAVAVATGVAEAGRAASARRRGVELVPGVPTPAPSPGLVAGVAVDALIGMPIALLSSTGSEALYRRAGEELDASVRFHEASGWLDDPHRRHRAEITPPEGRIEGDPGHESLRFPSGWAPEDGEPGGDRWRAAAGDDLVPVRLLRHAGGPRPWLVAVHGQGMGRPGDEKMLRVRRLHEELGINVALPVLPKHGPRAAGLSPDQQFVSNLFVANNVLGLSQSIWDLRRLLAWLRVDQGAPAVGVLGLSLGSYACSLLSTIEADLACVVAVVPTTDLAASLRHAEPLLPSRRRWHRVLHDERSTAVHRVVSPVARPCLVPHDRRFVVAGQADRIAPPAGAAALRRHWEDPATLWRPRGHVTTPRTDDYDDFVMGALRSSGLSSGR